ncbi:MAG: polysaccharide ABC transporter ATP-binding protein [Gemmatimonadota bacterium]|nr:polysaccharide ABC transporter ATP-binding protein [Gemmatimonadota bacterium]
MSEIAIRVESIGKEYHIGATPVSYRTLRDRVAGAATEPFRRAWKLARGQAYGAARMDETFWALRDLSFEVETGEVVGVIGRNGAGKSTLLKILSRITEPSEGWAEVHGRVGSLLEVGTGFHPELTGRENVFMNGAILGMRKAEIDRKFDEIVEFSEISKFIDTPVKHYSSGMYVRLAFAVAAHMEAQILLIDEVLSVGDAEFQRKCLGKMGEVAGSGRTIIFVSHNMPTVARLCDRVLLLDQGRLVKDGPSAEVVHTYLSYGISTSAEREWTDPARAPGNDRVRIRAVRVRRRDGAVTENVDIREPVVLEQEYEVLQGGQALTPLFVLHNDEGVCVFATHGHDTPWRQRPRPPGRYRASVEIPGNFLAEGMLLVLAAVVTQAPFEVHAEEADAVAFHVVGSLEPDTSRGDYGKTMPGVLSPLLPWTDEAVEEGAAARRIQTGGER